MNNNKKMDNNNNNQVDVGDLVTYTIKIENKGTEVITNLIINESNFNIGIGKEF